MIENKASEDNPPILGSWNKMYIVVLIAHSVIIGLFILFTNLYA